MHNNGVTHAVASQDSDGIRTTLDWLSYMPASKGAALPIIQLPVPDPVDREIDFKPTKTPYDPRFMLEGQMNGSVWESGFFDRGSWQVDSLELLQSIMQGYIMDLVYTFLFFRKS